MKVVLPIILITVVVLAVFYARQTGESSYATDEKQIRETFETYRKAIIDGDGATALTCVDDKTLKGYQQYLTDARRATAQELAKKPIVHQLQIIIMRSRLTPDQLKAFDGAALLKHTIDAGWVGRDNVKGLSLGDVKVKEDRAAVEVLVGGVKTDLIYFFNRHGDKWGLDLMNIVEMTNPLLREEQEKSGKSMKAYVTWIVEQTLKKKIPASVWDPTASDIPNQNN